MPRLFVVFRTFDRIWACRTYTRELAPFEMDISQGPIKLMFMVEQIIAAPNGKDMFVLDTHFIGHNSTLQTGSISFYCHAHENLFPVILKQLQGQQEQVVISPTNGAKKGLMRRYSVPSLELGMEGKSLLGQFRTEDVIYFVLPTYRCTIVMDAHVASCVNCEYSRSRIFRRHFWHYICQNKGFRNCVPDYLKWTQEERDAWENYLSVPYMIDVVAVWPKQKIDYAWSKRILGLLNKHVTLQEGFAWLSTLGGAHSSLGEIFTHHAEQAGKISGQQLQLAIELGNESLIARCYIFWSWSLLQRGELRRSKICVINVWKFCHTLRSSDVALENMCQAIWSRLRYKRALLKSKIKQCRKIKTLDKDDQNGGGDSSDVSSNIISSSSSSSDSSSGDISSKNNTIVCIKAPGNAHSAVTNSLCVH